MSSSHEWKPVPETTDRDDDDTGCPPPARGQVQGLGKEDLGRQTKSVIVNVLQYVKNLADPVFLRSVDFKKSQELVSRMCGVSLRSVQRCVREHKTRKLSSPRKNYKRDKKVTVVSDLACDVVRRTVLDFYDRGEFPTAEKVYEELKGRNCYAGSVRSLRRTLQYVGFKYKRANDGWKYLLERHDVVLARTRFLRKMHDLKMGDFPKERVYLDETWINHNHTRESIWQRSDRNGGLKIPTGKGGGRRVVVCHAGSVRGFVRRCGWTSPSEITPETFKEWFRDRLLPSLEEPTAVVMDCASYHSVRVDDVPCTTWRKTDIRDWLSRKGVRFSEGDTRAELLEKVVPFEGDKKYDLDEVAHMWGHQVVRLPPFHCQYNPIELIWAQVKEEIAQKNKTFSAEELERSTSEALDNVTVAQWEKCVRHAEKLQEDDWQKEIRRDDVLEPVLTILREDSTGGEDSEDGDGWS